MTSRYTIRKIGRIGIVYIRRVVASNVVNMVLFYGTSIKIF